MPATPYLAVDVPRLRANVRRMADRAAISGVALRPHVKTHKSPDIARIQVGAGATGITVATVGEAEVFARHGFTDIFVAYPVWVDGERATRLRDLMPQATVTVGVESAEGAAALGRHLGGTSLGVLVEVDSGHHRTGVAAERAGDVAAVARRAGLQVRGVFTFPGHGYAPGLAAQAAEDEVRTLSRAAESLRAVGIEPQVLSGGSTPTLAHAAAWREVPSLTELRPGVYVFGDAQQWELGATEPADIALTCRATVVSHRRRRLVLDCGSKILGADRASYSSGHGRLLRQPHARIVELAEHHAVVEVGRGPVPALGDRVDVVPNHVCTAVNLVDRLYLSESNPLLTWTVAARGQNS